MGTRWSVSVDADHTVDLTALREDLAAAVDQVDQQMSPWKPDSDLQRLKRRKPKMSTFIADRLLEVESAYLGAGPLDHSLDLADPLLVYERGEFDAAQTEVVAEALGHGVEGGVGVQRVGSQGEHHRARARHGEGGAVVRGEPVAAQPEPSAFDYANRLEARQHRHLVGDAAVARPQPMVKR